MAKKPLKSNETCALTGQVETPTLNLPMAAVTVAHEVIRVIYLIQCYQGAFTQLTRVVKVIRLAFTPFKLIQVKFSLDST